ncbi:MAG TPA: zf-HC2 domain-containing protein [Marmoricola sp.]|nr:zf-HC2 domain-containing protein [Marmoricola sp.]
MSVPCESAAAYVLGALPAAERSTFEQHLATCADCRDTVADLAGLPGLLARVSVEDLADRTPAPDTLVPRLVREVRRSGRRRRLVVAGLTAAAVVLAVAGTVTIVDSQQQPDRQTGETMEAMEAVVPSPVTATAAVVRRAWGTEITMKCRYGDSTEWSRPYALVAVDDGGRTYQIGTWVVGPGKTASISGSVPVQPEHLDRLEIQLLSGTPLLRLRPS